MNLISTNLVVTQKCGITVFYSNQVNLTLALHLIRAMGCLPSVTCKVVLHPSGRTYIYVPNLPQLLHIPSFSKMASLKRPSLFEK